MGREQFLQLVSSDLETQLWGEGLRGNFKEKSSTWRSCKAVGNDLRGGVSWGVSLPPLTPRRKRKQECKAPRNLQIWERDCKQCWSSRNPVPRAVPGTLRTPFCLISIFLTAPWHDTYYHPHFAEEETETETSRNLAEVILLLSGRLQIWILTGCGLWKSWTNATR